MENMENMDLGKKLRYLRKKKKLTLEQVAKKLNVYKQTVFKYENSIITNIPLKNIEILANIYDVTPAELLGWENYSVENGVQVNKKAYKIPVYGEIAAGIPISAIQDIIDYEEIDEALMRKGELLALKVKGNSMSPRICNGDVVIIKKQSDCESGDICAVMVNGASATLKKVRKTKNGIYLDPLNTSEYHTRFYTISEVETLPVTIMFTFHFG